MEIFKIALEDTERLLKRVKAEFGEMSRPVKDKYNQAVAQEDFLPLDQASKRREFQEFARQQLSLVTFEYQVEEADRQGLKEITREIDKIERGRQAYEKVRDPLRQTTSFR
jgi:hypothetical protein